MLKSEKKLDTKKLLNNFIVVLAAVILYYAVPAWQLANEGWRRVDTDAEAQVAEITRWENRGVTGMYPVYTLKVGDVSYNHASLVPQSENLPEIGQQVQVRYEAAKPENYYSLYELKRLPVLLKNRLIFVGVLVLAELVLLFARSRAGRREE